MPADRAGRGVKRFTAGARMRFLLGLGAVGGGASSGRVVSGAFGVMVEPPEPRGGGRNGAEQGEKESREDNEK